jgi:glycerophosphoryl diester phosphodiesterase
MAIPISTTALPSPPLVIASRGASADAPENTIAAFELAIEQGADALALAVHLSKDDQLVVINDFTLERTTDGAGPVRDHTVRELKRLDAGGWYGRGFRGQRVQTLHEILERFRDRIRLWIEIRGGVEVYPDIDEGVVSTVEIYEATERVLIQSLDRPTLDSVRARSTEIPLATRVARGPLEPVLEAPGPVGALCVRFDLLRADTVAAAKRAGLECHAWTISDLAHVPALLASRVAGIITDKPGLLRTGLRR